MGGIIGLTIRFSDGEEYRGSSWTNILPGGLFHHDFYDPKTSEEYVRGWLKNILKNREEVPDVEELWGGWNKLAPVEYGLVVVDYKKSGIMSCNGYTNPDLFFTFGHAEGPEKFFRLYRKKLIDHVMWNAKSKGDRLGPGPLTRMPVKILKKLDLQCQRVTAYNGEFNMWGQIGGTGRPGQAPDRPNCWVVQVYPKLPFKEVAMYEEDEEGQKAMYDWVKKRFTLKPKETRAWKRWFADREMEVKV